MKERNWTEDETTLLCEILSDPNSNFVSVLESRALKKAPTRDIFGDILNIFNTELQKKAFVDINLKNFSEKKHFTPLNTDVRKLQAKYNNIKTKWREHSNRLAKGIGHGAKERWYSIMDPLFADRKTRQMAAVVAFEPDEMDVKSGVYVSVDWDEDENQPLSFSSIRDKPATHNISQYSPNKVLHFTNDREVHHSSHDRYVINNTFHTIGDAVHEHIQTSEAEPLTNVNTQFEENGTGERSYTDALYQLASSINNLADVNAKRLKLEFGDREAQLKFKREEAEANRKHELEMAELTSCHRRVFPSYVKTKSHYCSSTETKPCKSSRDLNELPSETSKSTELSDKSDLHI